MNTTKLSDLIKASAKSTPADLVIKNGKIIDVFNLEIIEENLAIKNGMIIGIGDYEAIDYLDAKGAYICPGFIDGHVHMESSMVHPFHFSHTLIEHGVTTIITDPHEIANVSGSAGVQFMIDATKDVLVDVYFMLPSCVPATPFEQNGATLHAMDLAPFYENDRVLGLAEVMDFPAVRDTEEKMLEKLTQAVSERKQIDGHGAGLTETGINIYRSAQIKTDHECVTAEEALERIRRGMYVMIREGSVAKDLKALLPAVNDRNARRFLFCTDDKHLDDLVREGSIDHNIRLAIQEGMDPLLAIQIATLNAAECYSLQHKGAVAPGYHADLVLVGDLRELTIQKVLKDGKLVPGLSNESVKSNIGVPHSAPAALKKSVHIKSCSPEDLKLTLDGSKEATVIEIIPNSLVTNHIKEMVQTKDGEFAPCIKNDQLKLAVVERHNATGDIGIGIVKGMRLKNGAIASTVAHDSHNIVAVGTNDGDILEAIRTLEDMGGGLVVVKDRKPIATLSLEIAGLMSLQPLEEVLDNLECLHHALTSLGMLVDFNPFVTLSFLSLPVIPEIKLTASGLFDVAAFSHISIQ
ncbi:adenine deaminase [Bacillus tianshenii]|uniref:adenine deaminase n=1 Tax=Sutcliffiella tianshenii TaxID=1463404 RepID=UPI001CD67962|nr:adenine deaminase [Bacillus tianshenii]MCA1321237.1 adenine deaminase [Bacillus tianshenii]